MNKASGDPGIVPGAFLVSPLSYQMQDKDCKAFVLIMGSKCSSQ